MSYQQSMLQQVEEDQRWGGNGWTGTQGSHGRLKTVEEGLSSLAEEVDGAGASRSGGGSGSEDGGYRFAAPSMLNTGTRSGYGGDLTLFSPSDLFSSSPRQPLQQQTGSSSPFSWQSLLSGRAQPWQPDAAVHGFAAFGGDQVGVQEVSDVNAVAAYGDGSGNGRPRGGGGSEQCLTLEDDGVISEVEADRNGDVKEEWTNNLNSEKENWRKFGGMSQAFR